MKIHPPGIDEIPTLHPSHDAARRAGLRRSGDDPTAVIVEYRREPTVGWVTTVTLDQSAFRANYGGLRARVLSVHGEWATLRMMHEGVLVSTSVHLPHVDAGELVVVPALVAMEGAA